MVILYYLVADIRCLLPVIQHYSRPHLSYVMTPVNGGEITRSIVSVLPFSWGDPPPLRSVVPPTEGATSTVPGGGIHGEGHD